MLKYDNIRGLGILLIVFFHIMLPFFQIPGYDYLLNILIIINLPLIFFISGYFSKISENSSIKAFKGIMVPYIVFTILWIIFILLLGFNFPKAPFLIPVEGLWYLISLFSMRLLLPIFVKIKHIWWILFIVALLIGTVTFPSKVLSIGKTIYYLPIFMMGYYFRNSDYYFNDLPSKFRRFALKLKNLILKNKFLIFIILIIFIAGIGLIVSSYTLDFFEFQFSYSELDLGKKLGILMRLSTLIASLVIVILITYLMTDKRTFLTKIGANSLVVYVLHFYFAKPLNMFLIHSEIGILLKNSYILSAIYILVASFVITYVLSRDILTNKIQKGLDFISNLFIKPIDRD